MTDPRIPDIIETLMRQDLTASVPDQADRISLALRTREVPGIVLPAVRRLAENHRLTVMEVGARGGIGPQFQPYADCTDFILCECEPEEAERLRRQGHMVVDRLIAGEEVEAQAFHVTRNPRVSSSRMPQGRMLPFIAGAMDPDPERFDVQETLSLPTTTVDAVERSFGRRVDILRLDTQGTEWEILSGMQSACPVLIETEVSLAELYVGQKLFYDIGSLLTDRGYVIFDLVLGPYRAPPAGNFPSMRRMPLHGDAYFMPDWTHPAGREMIASRPHAWIMALLIYGLEDLIVYLLRANMLPESAAKAVWSLSGLQAPEA